MLKDRKLKGFISGLSVVKKNNFVSRISVLPEA